MAKPKTFTLTDRYNQTTDRLEAKTVARLDAALDRSFRQLEQELRATYPKIAANGDLFATQRKVLILNELGETLQLVRPGQQAEYERLLNETLKTAAQTGSTLADELVKAKNPDSIVPSMAGINLEAAALQARDGAERLRRHSEDFRNKASAVIEQGLIQGWGTGRVSQVLRAELGATKSKAETIARTEVLSALNDAAQERYKRYGVEYVQLIVTIGDVCPFCVARSGNVYEVGKIRVPLHPRCRCVLVPWRKEWQEMGLTDDEFIAEYTAKRIGDLEKAGFKVNNGLSPFEKMAGATKPPELVWKPGMVVQPVTPPAKPQHEQLIERGRTVAMRQTAKIDGLTAQWEKAEAKFVEAELALAQGRTAQRVEKYFDAMDALIAAEKQRDTQSLTAMADLRRQLISKGLSAEKAEKLAAKIQIDAAAAQEVSPEVLRARMQQFFQLTGGRGSESIKRLVLTDDRAYADDEDGSINIGRQRKERQMASLWHEAGHHAELENPVVREAAAAWVRSRATGGVQKLSILIPNSGYEDDEAAYPDKFIDPYVGKIYSDGSTEVVSMGIEHFTTPKDMLELYRRDPDHFHLILGILR